MALGRIVFLGDIICTLWDLQHNSNYSNWFSKTVSYWEGADYVVANLETPIAGEDAGYTSHPYSFNTPIELLIAIKNANISLLATANNHCLDRGINGLFQTITELERVGIKHTGTFKKKKDRRYEILEVAGKKIGILSVTYGTNAQENHFYLPIYQKHVVNMLQEQELYEPISRILWKTKTRYRFGFRRENQGEYAHNRVERDSLQRYFLHKIIQSMQRECDLCVVLMHAGSQFNSHPTERSKKWMRWLDNEGVDLVIGNHEHLISSTYVTGRMLGFYALGDLTGTFGVTQEPYGLMAETSVAVNMYFEQSLRYTFSFFLVKNIDGNYVPVSLYDEYQKETCKEERNYLYWLNLRLYNRILQECETRLPVQKEYEIERQNGGGFSEKRSKDVLDLTISWLGMKQNNGSLKPFFSYYDYRTVAIYGAGKMGERLYDELTEIDIDVAYVIDKKCQGEFHGKKIISPMDRLEKVDIIVVTPISAFESITKELSQRTKIPIVSLAEIIIDVSQNCSVTYKR